jgi:serine/threonine-protein kinase
MNEARPTLSPGMQVTPSVRLVEPLGAGGMGAVWLADHTSLKTRVVVKFMLGELGSSASARLRFSREAAAAAQVKSPHVVHMHDHGVTPEGLPFIVMEYLEGHDLAYEIANHGPIAPAKVVAIVSQVAKALGKVHAGGLLHRDIKPDNIFLVASDDDEVFVKLLDFGIAKSHDAAHETTLDGQTRTGQVVGTPFYMSPEQVTAQKSIDARSDLWALGVVTFEALTGQRPFDGPSFGALAVKIATGTPPIPSEVMPSLPQKFDAWFARACAREPKDRFATAKELAEALRASFEGVVSLPPPVVSSDSGARSAKASTLPTISGSGERAVSEPSTRVGSSPEADRPSFVLASTAEAPPALAKSEAGLAIGDAPGNAPRARKGPPAFAIVGTLAALVVVAVVAFKLGAGGSSAPRGTISERPEKSAGRTAAPSASQHAAPAISTAATAPPATASVALEPTQTAASEAMDAGKPPSRPGATRPPTTAAKPPPPPATTTKAEPSTKPATPPPSATIDVY